MNPHPIHTGEHLAQECLDRARGNYGLAAEALWTFPDSQQRTDAFAALALWAAFAPVANDN